MVFGGDIIRGGGEGHISRVLSLRESAAVAEEMLNLR